MRLEELEPDGEKAFLISKNEKLHVISVLKWKRCGVRMTSDRGFPTGGKQKEGRRLVGFVGSFHHRYPSHHHRRHWCQGLKAYHFQSLLIIMYLLRTKCT